jgi:hypothetical protein
MDPFIEIKKVLYDQNIDVETSTRMIEDILDEAAKDIFEALQNPDIPLDDTAKIVLDEIAKSLGREASE